MEKKSDKELLEECCLAMGPLRFHPYTEEDAKKEYEHQVLPVRVQELVRKYLILRKKHKGR